MYNLYRTGQQLQEERTLARMAQLLGRKVLLFKYHSKGKILKLVKRHLLESTTLFLHETKKSFTGTCPQLHHQGGDEHLSAVFLAPFSATHLSWHFAHPNYSIAHLSCWKYTSFPVLSANKSRFARWCILLIWVLYILDWLIHVYSTVTFHEVKVHWVLYRGLWAYGWFTATAFVCGFKLDEVKYFQDT